MKLKIFAVAICTLLLFVSNNAFSENHKKPSMSESIIVKLQLEVIEINHDSRWVRLKDSAGFTRKIDVSEDVRNFDQVAIGDIVNVNYAETIQIKAFGPDAIASGKEAEAIFARSPKGKKPGKVMAVAETFVVTIAAIDSEKSLVTLKDQQGNSKTFRPRMPSNLKKVQVGDKVAISFAEALAIAVKKGE